ncbi:MAG TPA: menaquinone-dependent protoporphyrinogen IX dehydrogenase [Gammaproteobacteria bacterium]
MANILILYSTTDGHTKKICLKIQSVVESLGHDVKLFPIEDKSDIDIMSFDKIIIGASIRYGKHKKEVIDFVDQNQLMLKNKPSAFFSVNVVARKSDKNHPDTNPYMRKFLSQVSWRPDKLEVFAGKIDYKKYRFFDRWMIRMIMFMTNGPTDPETVTEFTDWHQVEKFGRDISQM